MENFSINLTNENKLFDDKWVWACDVIINLCKLPNSAMVHFLRQSFFFQTLFIKDL